MLKRLLVITYCLCAATLNSCSKNINSTYEKKLTQFFKKQGITNIKVICDVKGRNGKCILTNTSNSFNKLIKRLNLKDFQSKDIKNNFKYYNYWLDYKERQKNLVT